MKHKLWNCMIWMKVNLKDQRGDFGLGSIISIAIGLIVTAFIILPSVRSFADGMMTGMQSWWTDTVSQQLFPSN